MATLEGDSDGDGVWGVRVQGFWWRGVRRTNSVLFLRDFDRGVHTVVVFTCSTTLLPTHVLKNIDWFRQILQHKS